MRNLFRSALGYGRRVAAAACNRFGPRGAVYYVTEPADWVIRRIGQVLAADSLPGFTLTLSPAGIRHSIVHYGTPYSLWSQGRIHFPHATNRIVATWFHVLPDDSRLGQLPEVAARVDLWHTASNMTREKLIRLGIPAERIVLVPLGVDLDIFRPAGDDEKRRVREKLELPPDKVVIGSFQKDGVGWQEGSEPKLIKGPDILCDCLQLLAKRCDLFVLLVGPARGYVKKRLEAAKVPYRHFYLDNYSDIARYYRALDLYLVTAREEGGPLAVLEAMASGVPVVSARVGLVPDVIKDNENGLLAEVGNVPELVDKAAGLIAQPKLQERFRQNGLVTIQGYDWELIAGLYRQKIYEPLRAKVS